MLAHLVPALAMAAMLTAPHAQSRVTTVFIVRHAEKATEPASRDPALSEAGQRRAQALAKAVRSAGVTAVFSTDTRRTRDTATPAATQASVQVELYDHQRPEELIRRIRERYAGQSILIVGHSNTVPGLVQAFGGSAVEEIPESEYDNLFVVTATSCGEQAHTNVTRLRYGE